MNPSPKPFDFKLIVKIVCKVNPT